jgi:hypothetical protein
MTNSFIDKKKLSNTQKRWKKESFQIHKKGEKKDENQSPGLCTKLTLLHRSKEFVIMVSHEIHHYWLFLLVLQLKLKFLCYDIIYTSNKLEMNLIKNKSTNSGVFLYS